MPRKAEQQRYKPGVESGAGSAGVFVYRFRERKPDGGYRKRTELIGPVSVLKTETNAWRAVENRKLEINSEGCEREGTMNAVISRYFAEELPDLRHSTVETYRSCITNHIQPRWGSHPVAKIKSLGVELWLKQLTLATEKSFGSCWPHKWLSAPLSPPRNFIPLNPKEFWQGRWGSN